MPALRPDRVLRAAGSSGARENPGERSARAESTVADAISGRPVHGALRIALMAKSLRSMPRTAVASA
jgi:hypothetical protein